MFGKLFQRVSEVPTNPQTQPAPREFDVADLYRGPVAVDEGEVAAALPLDEKLRQAYFWIVNHAIISPFYDIEYHDGAPQTFVFGDAKGTVTLPSGQSYCSFVLLPLLTFAVRAKCLLIGGPGRGKTSSAILMGVLAGYSLRDVRRAIQKGQPQMTIADLIGSPLPADLVAARSLDQIGIGWRKWLSMRVKIIDEYFAHRIQAPVNLYLALFDFTGPVEGVLTAINALPTKTVCRMVIDPFGGHFTANYGGCDAGNAPPSPAGREPTRKTR